MELLRFEVTVYDVVYIFTDMATVDYGIAWQTSAVPEPAACVLFFGVAAKPDSGARAEGDAWSGCRDCRTAQ